MTFQRLLPALALCLGLIPAEADDFYRVPGMRINDVFLTRSGLDQKLPGRVVELQTGARMYFRDNGTWSMEPRDGVQGPTGRYSFGPKGQVCVRYDGGGGRCDSYVRSVKKYVMIDGNGQRHEVKSILRE